MSTLGSLFGRSVSVRTSHFMAVPEDLAQDAQRDMARLRIEDRVHREDEEAEGSRRRAITIELSDGSHSQSSAMRCKACGRLGHHRKTHFDCLMNPQRLLIAGSNAKANAPPTDPSAFATPAVPAAPYVPAVPALAAPDASDVLMLLMPLLNYVFSEMD